MSALLGALVVIAVPGLIVATVALLRERRWRGATPLRAPYHFHDPRIAQLPSQVLRELLDETQGHLRQLRADVDGLENASKDQWARLHEVVYRKDSRYAEYDQAAKAMADVAEPPQV